MIGRLVILLSLVVMAGIVSAHTAKADLVVLGNGHAPIYVSDKDLGDFDIDNDGLVDYYVRAHFTGNSHQQYKVDYKIADDCVDGSTYDVAKMKIGFSNTAIFPSDLVWYTNFEVWNPWFKASSNDANRKIDPISLPNGALPDPFPVTGDDVITKNPSDKKGSFTHKDVIPELDGQSGWEGSVFFKGEPGSYRMWTIHPGGGIPGSCDILTGFTIPIIIKP